MRFTLQMGGRKVLVLSRDRFVEFDALSKAAAWVADYIVSPVNLFTLRASLASDPTYQHLLRLDLADLVVSLARLLMSGRLRGLVDPRNQRQWRWRLPETPTFADAESSGDAEAADLAEAADETEEKEDEYEEVKPDPVIPPEFPRLAQRQADAVDFAARRMGLQLDLLRFTGEKETPESSVAKEYKALASQQSGALDEAVGNASGTLNSLAGVTDIRPPRSAVAKVMPDTAKSAGAAVMAKTELLQSEVDNLATGTDFARPDSTVTPVFAQMAASQGQAIADQAVDAGAALATLNGDPPDPPSPSVVSPEFATQAARQGKAINDLAEEAGDSLDDLNSGQIEDPPAAEMPSVFTQTVDAQTVAVNAATTAAIAALEALASTADERAEVPAGSDNATIIAKGSERAGEAVHEAAAEAARALDDLVPGETETTDDAEDDQGGRVTIKLDAPPGVPLKGLMFRIKVGDEERVALSDANGIVELTGIPKEGYDIIGISDGAGLEVVDVRASRTPTAPADGDETSTEPTDEG